MRRNGECRPHRHIFIAGTGRAGTSFLVRYLDALGLETHISKSGDDQWHAKANAGLEDLPFAAPAESLPYVVKTPWISEFVDQLLADRSIAIDAVVIPVRELSDAATSRIIVELSSLYENVEWMTSFEDTRHWGATPGGGVFSLDPVDQERILAVEYARLVRRLVRSDVAVVFLDFPRIVEDADYLFDKLRPYLPAGPDRTRRAKSTAPSPTPARFAWAKSGRSPRTRGKRTRRRARNGRRPPPRRLRIGGRRLTSST